MAERIRETDDIRSGVKGRGSEREQSKKKYAEKRNPYHIWYRKDWMIGKTLTSLKLSREWCRENENECKVEKMHSEGK